MCLLRAPFSLEKITWNESTGKVIYRSKRSWHTKRIFISPAPEPRSGRALRPLWRDLIMKVWGEDPHKCPCCPGTMKVVGTMIGRSEVEFFLRLHGLWEGVIALPTPPDPPFDIEKRRGIGGVLDNRAERDGRTDGSPEGQGTAAVKGEAVQEKVQGKGSVQEKGKKGSGKRGQS